MKSLFSIVAFSSLFIFHAEAQDVYKMQPVTIQTRWAKEVSPNNALKEYPRPQMVRDKWQNLNGLWEYAITPKNGSIPDTWEGKILVPYPIESALSGVKKSLQPDQLLWYRKTIAKPEGEKVLLHFGAVDFQATIFVNGKEVGRHSGGYEAFTLDITNVLKTGDNVLVVKVYDPTDEGIGPHGKQVLHPASIYYTSSSGIWQTVWLESVPKTYIEGLVLTPDIDKGVLEVKVNAPAGNAVEVTALDRGNVVGKVKGKAGIVFSIPVKDAKLWSPENPFLYDLVVKMKGDEVKSYFGMRKISLGKDEKGVTRIFLNNKPYFNLGTLDQGFWPDGLYTAPTDEALKFDIEAIKAMGFNTIHKHIQIDPARWYYHADKIGMLVWQDFVNPNQSLPEGAKPEFEKESKEILEQLHNAPSIVTWVLFNEQWGSYDQERLTKWVKQTDPGRLVNGHTGEYIFINGDEIKSGKDNWVASDIVDVHSYPNPMNAPAQNEMVRVVGEFGGIGVFIPDHQWNPINAWGYIQEKPAALESKFAIMAQHLRLLHQDGLSASIYTQPFDVEGEQNGLMTYDREVVKIPFDKLRKIHAPLNPSIGTIPTVVAQNADLTEPAELYSRMLEVYINGKRDHDFLLKLAMTAKQVGDLPGADMAGNAYIAGLSGPLTEDDIRIVGQFARSSKDAGYIIMSQHSEQFKKVLGERQYQVNMMNMVYKGVMEPMMKQHKDWKEIESVMKEHGAPGDEMFLRMKTVVALNAKDWAMYVPAATAYLNKYGDYIKGDEKSMFQNALDQAKKN
ncbi:glycoside hydrolase family 2 TIM barrel-domain containing protein [Chitinophaga sancti]|uniref:glycoside hydrolase family 2 protein n=1 Tax=Chitinophaga sancti TaxID=1004 RepID=UPI002E1631A0|nr:sugar-binding domain-containing protein [Chitinophaga sancti]WQD59551.1 glycoside hydrolase family 2 TIM barrel-domain containing protein [Chitinophaga sancti]